MPIFGKKSNADEDDGESSLGPDDVAATEGTAPVSKEEEEGEEVDGLLGRGSDLLDDADSGTQDGENGAEAKPSGEDDEDASDEDLDLDLKDDLMSIFTSEEEEDEELSALTTNLEEIEASALLSQALDMVQRLRERK